MSIVTFTFAGGRQVDHPCRPMEEVAGAAYVRITAGIAFFDAMLDRYGATGWNAFTRRLDRHAITHLFSLSDDTVLPDHNTGQPSDLECAPLVFEIDLSGEDMSGRNLKGLDLSFVNLAGANLSNCDLRHSQIGRAIGVSFRGANLRGSSAFCDISDSDFEDAVLDKADFVEANHFIGCPPRGLPSTLLASLHTFDHDPPPTPTWDGFRRPLPIMFKSATLHSFRDEWRDTNEDFHNEI